ncbi:3-oxoacyl-[acyl-carrier-protein] synthase III C-terminal domain-containing protein [Kutzneria buriramensis]|uniref:3-oxoacyl-[acyl-carrier-protein] synthase-3 n=1 Tax=Kutzneria buriramensis TaxID=1045776 RepID=A0A3E0H0V2_9PSEU|nr:3-oxoacyl-[acyl-carrier-protein] synthase III C-terminal domain-containing protein [Kutzneria buriramensis]REH35679.1 3-oxoacyl-[acyl-carrier-protein] synthase-3 [Kutzneria buriramensis]
MATVHLSGLDHELGTRTPLAQVDEPTLREQLQALHEQGLRHCRVADRPVVELAAASARRTLAAVPPDTVDAVVFCSDNSPEPSPTAEIWDFLDAVGLPRTPATFVSGAGCGNLGPALNVARGMVLTGDRSAVLVVTADRVREGTRYLANGQTVMSDAAASCVVGAEAFGAGFELRAIADSCRVDIGTVADRPILVARATTQGIRSAVRGVTERLSLTTNDFRHLVTGNYGRSALDFLATSAGVPTDRVAAPLLADAGHCFAGDPLITLSSLVDTGQLGGDDQALMLTVSPRSWSAIAVRHIRGQTWTPHR